MDRSRKRRARVRRHARITRTIRGTAERPRLSVYRSNVHVYAQLIDDDRGHTIVAASSNDGGADVTEGTKSEVAREVGQLIAERAKAQGIDRVVFDRGGFRYAGRVRALAEGARDGGLEF